MKILHLLYESKGDYFGIGGVGIRAYEIYSRLKVRHEITLLCKKYPGTKDSEIEGIKHIFVGTESKSFTKALLSYAYHAVQFVRKWGNNYDIIIEEFSPAIPTFLHVFTKRPIILQVQGYTGKLYFNKYNPFYGFALSVLEKVRPIFYDNFIFVNHETVQKLLPHFFLAKKCIEIIPNGIAPELLKSSPEERDYILYLGRIDIYGKGLDTLVDAYKEFYESFSDIKLFIAGDGRDMDKFKAILTKLPENIRKNIEILGWVTGEKKTDVIGKALFCVFPSRHEVQPIAVLEAMACGKAVIVSDISAFSFVVDNNAGVCFRTGDVKSLCQSMKKIMNNNERIQMGQNGRNLVREFTWDKIALKYDSFLNKVLE